MAFVYNDKIYKTLSDAANKLGLSQSYLSGLKSSRNLSDAGAVEYAIKQQDTEHMRGNNKECIVFRRHYPSIAAACRYYEIPYISVHSRMSRHGESVEKAIDVLLKKREENDSPEDSSDFIIADYKEFWKFWDYPIDRLNSPTQGLIKKLFNRGYSTSFFLKKGRETPIIKISAGDINFNKNRCWINIRKKQTSLILTDFCAPVKAEDRALALERLNAYNSLNIGFILWLRKEPQTDFFDITVGCHIPNNTNNEPTVMTVLRGIEKILNYSDLAEGIFFHRITDNLRFL